MELKTYASLERFLHPSGLLVLDQCAWRAADLHMNDYHDGGGPAGDTGSAVHAAVALWHKGASKAEAILGMGDRRAEYPKADMNDATIMFVNYVTDPRNQGLETPLVEHPISFTIAPLPDDPTGEPIHVQGRLDQVRRVDGSLRLCDIKTSKRDPMEVLNEATFQVAAYCIGASVLLQEEVRPGPIIMPRKYVPGNPGGSPVFWHYPWKYEDIPAILYGVRVAVANLRAGRVWHSPNSNCRWCQLGGPDLCFPKLKNWKQKNGLE